MEWRWIKFSDLTVAELYEVLSLRERVFVVEQACAYQDSDGYDPRALHLLGRRHGELVAYLRAFPTGVKYPEMSLGRVAVAVGARGGGLGRELMVEGLKRMRETWGGGPIKISAQAYLVGFYQSLGFEAAGSEYLDDGIPHRDMYLGKT